MSFKILVAIHQTMSVVLTSVMLAKSERIMKFKSFALIMVLLSGCSGGSGTMDGIMASWQGANLDQVIDRWGYPDEERNIAGRTLYVWDRDVSLSLPATTTGTITTLGNTSYLNTTSSGGGISNWSCRRILEVNQQKIIVGSQWSGNNCPFAEMGPYANWRR